MSIQPRDPIVELADVHLKLASQAGEVNILRGVDLRVLRGETVAVVGPSGSRARIWARSTRTGWRSSGVDASASSSRASI
jgi:predicted ABC-type transport system involved in lysophospholipase L1 biosynthesis ATPase subunit